MSFEIEKRYYVKGDIPKDKIIKTINITQLYASLNPDVRIRKVVDGDKEEYSHCVKYNISKGIREEIENEITSEQYENIFKFINKKPLEKERIIVDIGNNLIAEVDKFKDTDKIIVEVEFENENDMNSFIKPNWFGEEVKEGQMYSSLVFTAINSNSIFDRLML